MAPRHWRDGDAPYQMGTRVWLQGFGGDAAHLNGQRATVLLGEAGGPLQPPRYFLEADDGQRLQAWQHNVRQAEHRSAGEDERSLSHDERPVSWHAGAAWQSSVASIDTDFPAAPALPGRPRPVSGARSEPVQQATGPGDGIFASGSAQESVEQVTRRPDAYPRGPRVGDLLSDSLRRLPLRHVDPRGLELVHGTPPRSTSPPAQPGVQNFQAWPEVPTILLDSPDMLWETIDISCQHVQRLAKEMAQLSEKPVLDVHTEVITSTSGFGSRCTCGIMLAGSRIDNLVIGGPAFNSGKLSKNDEILRVDGTVCSTQKQIFDLIVGSDEPDTPVTLTVRLSRDGAIDNVTLVRMANEEIADKRALFELFTQLKDIVERLGGSDSGHLCDRVILLWSKMVLADAVHDETIEERVQSMQAGIRTLAEELTFHIGRVHALNMSLASRLSVSDAVVIEMVLDLDMTEKFEQEAFGLQVVRDVASAVGGVQDKLKVLGVSKGSNTVKIGLGPGVCGDDISALAVARELKIQAAEDESQLRRGTVTQKLLGLTIKQIPEHIQRAEELEMQVLDGKRREEELQEQISTLKPRLGKRPVCVHV